MSQQRREGKRNQAQEKIPWELLDKILKDGQTGPSTGHNHYFKP